MTALLFPIAMASPPMERSPRAYLGWMLLLEAACMATFLSLDAFLFFVAFELTLVPGYFIIVNGNGPRRGYAATKFFLYTFAGSAFPSGGHPGYLSTGGGARAEGDDRHVQYRAAGPRRHALATERPGTASFVFRGGVRGEDAAGPVPYVDAGRLHARPPPGGRWSWPGSCSSWVRTAYCAGGYSFSPQQPSTWPR